MIYISFRFEDGHPSHYNLGFKTLKELNMVGSFYIITDKVGTPNAWPEKKNPYISYDQLKEIQENGNEIGSHSKSHVRGWLKKNKESIEDEIYGSLQELKKMNLDSKIFCFPFTDTTPEAIEIVEKYYEGYLGTYSHQRIKKGLLKDKHIPSLSIKGGFENLLENIVKKESDEDEWLIITIHEIIDNPSEVGIFPEDFNLIMNVIKGCVDEGTHKVVTIYEGFKIFRKN